ncbi:MAG: hypothetical protein Q8O67_14940 [Deltaproteobacteria bacterium]|nr:hypothetical protein [Deltaproteobacteria bacterium]
MRSPLGLAVVVAVAGALFFSGQARAEDLFQNLVGRQPKPLLDPAGFFAVVLPSGFDCQAQSRKVSCSSNRGVQATLSIDVVDVPVSATVEIVLLNQIDAFAKKPHYKLIGKKNLQVDGARALMATFTYDHFGNVEYAVGAQALYVVKTTKAYVIHYEGRADQFAAHKADLEQLYASFKTARLDGGGNPIVEDLKPRTGKNTGPAFDRIGQGGF